MSEKLTKLIVDCSTGETQVVPLTNEEMAQREIDVANALALQAEQDAISKAKAEAKTSALAKLTALGLTEEEVLAIAGN